MKELFEKRFWRGVVKTYVEAREGVPRLSEKGQTPADDPTPACSMADKPREDHEHPSESLQRVDSRTV